MSVCLLAHPGAAINPGVVDIIHVVFAEDLHTLLVRSCASSEAFKVAVLAVPQRFARRPPAFRPVPMMHPPGRCQWSVQELWRACSGIIPARLFRVGFSGLCFFLCIASEQPVDARSRRPHTYRLSNRAPLAECAICPMRRLCSTSRFPPSVW